MNRNYLLYLSAFVFLVFSFVRCEDWNLDRVDFIEITATLDSVSIDSVRIEGEILNLSKLIGNVESYGLIWTTKKEPLTFQSAEFNQRLGSKSKSDPPEFETFLRLEPNREYTLRSFATADNVRYFYSDAITYLTGNGMAFTDTIIYHGGFTMTAIGHLSGTDRGLSVIQHGFCWSKDNQDPKFVDADTVQLGPSDSSADFQYEIPLDSTAEIVPYYVRSYAIFQNAVGETSPVFGDPVLKFHGDLSFWTRIADYGGKASLDAIAFAIDSLGYVGTGRDVSSDQATNDFWAYNPETNMWTEQKPIPGKPFPAPRMGAAGFVLGKKGYVGTGRKNRKDYYRDFWEYDPSKGGWDQKQSFDSWSSVEPELRAYAVGFSVNSTGYLGLGEKLDGRLPDLTPYDTVKSVWVTDITGTIIGNTPEKATNLRRSHCISFVIDQKAYVGAGISSSGGITFSDLWEFDPALDENNWSEKASMPNPGIVAFAISGKAYVVAPRSSALNIGPNNPTDWNFFSYDPKADTWSRAARAPIHADVAFVINGVAYIGLGRDENGAAVKHFYRFNP